MLQGPPGSPRSPLPPVRTSTCQAGGRAGSTGRAQGGDPRRSRVSRPGHPGLGDPGSSRAGVSGAGRPQGSGGCRCAYLHSVAGHVLPPPARGLGAEGGVVGEARVRPARGVKGVEGAGTAGPRPSARPAPACSARAGSARPRRPRAAPSGPHCGRSRHVTAEVGARGGGGAEGRGSRRPLGLPARGAGRPLTAPLRLPPGFSGSALCSGVLHLSARKPEKSEPRQSREWRRPLASLDPSKNK